MDSAKDAAREEKKRAALMKAYTELVNTAAAIMMLQEARRQLPKEFSDETQLGKFLEGAREAQKAVDELAASEKWNPENATKYAALHKNFGDWIEFFRDNPLLANYMTLEEVIGILGQRALALGKKVVALAEELGILL